MKSKLRDCNCLFLLQYHDTKAMQTGRDMLSFTPGNTHHRHPHYERKRGEHGTLFYTRRGGSVTASNLHRVAQNPGTSSRHAANRRGTEYTARPIHEQRPSPARAHRTPAKNAGRAYRGPASAGARTEALWLRTQRPRHRPHRLSQPAQRARRLPVLASGRRPHQLLARSRRRLQRPPAALAHDDYPASPGTGHFTTHTNYRYFRAGAEPGSRAATGPGRGLPPPW